MIHRKLLSHLIALSLIAPIPALADSANVSLYGVTNVSYDSISTGTGTTATGTTVNKVSSNASRIGLKGTEDVGDGFSANWQIESLIALDNAGGTFATRNTFAGLSHKSYGALLLGRYDTPYKLSTRRQDNFSDSIADNRSLFGTVSTAATATAFSSAYAAFDGRQADTIAYTSPLIEGFSAALAYVNLDETATTAAKQKASAYSFAGMYDSGIIYASFAYEAHNLDTVRIGGKEEAWRAGLGYTMDNYSVGAAYEKTTDALGGAATLGTGGPTVCAALAVGSNCLGHSAAYLTGKYTIGSGAVKAAYSKVGALGYLGNTGADQLSLGYDHRLTKRTTLFTVYTKLTNQANANYGLGSAAFSSGAVASIGKGADPSALSFGMKHTF